MGDKIEDMDIEREHKDNKTEFLENKKGLPGSKFVEEINKLGFEKM